MRRYLTDASLLFGSDVAARALNFFTLVFLARTLQPDRYGLIVIGASALEYAFLFTDWGLKTLGVREAALEPAQRRFQPSTILAARVLLGLCVFVIAEAVTSLLQLDPVTRGIVRIYLLAVLPYAVTIDWYYQARRSYGIVTIARVLQSAILLVGVLTLVAGPEDVTDVPWLQVMAIATTAFLLLAAGRRKDRLRPTLRDLPAVPAALGTSSTLGAAGIFGQTFVVLPPLVVAQIAGQAAAGVLHAALRMVVLLLIVDRVFGALYLPAFASQWSRAGTGTAPRIRAALRILIPLGTSLSLLATIHATEIIDLVYEQQYAEGAIVLAIASWFVLATLMNTFFAYGLVAIGQERLYLEAGIVSGVVFVALVILLTSVWGIAGTAAAIVAGELLMTLLLYRFFRRHVDVRPFGSVAISLIAAAPLIAFAQLAEMTSLWLFPIYLAAFAGIVVALRGITPHDLRMLRTR